MRLWSLHPKYLDQKGLVALWRETLLAQNVLKGNTRGYTNHPQLIRFKESKKPIQFIGDYLIGIYEEAKKRGYSFDKSKISRKSSRPTKAITVTNGQMEYEKKHLLSKLKIRDKKRFCSFQQLSRVIAHPLFRVCTGKIESWEKIT